ncbi:MAG: hypothetical protein U9R79_22925 [Armatimonadota bacterium]|nr:hypothetical protein [Armatimonadota bacterium]
MRLALLMIPGLLLCISSGTGAATYYASPGGGGNGASEQSPFQVADFWEVAQPGDTLLLVDGTYTGERSMINTPEGTAGSADAPITVRALNDGGALIDGEGRLYPVQLYKCRHVHVEGINACRSKATVVSVSRSSHCAVRRICGWDAHDGNTNIFGVHYSDHTLVEDCAGWGIARKTYSCSQDGNYTTFRRCWGRWEGCHAVGPKMVFTCAYNSHHNLFENCIGTWDGRQMREEYTVLGYDGEPFTNWGSRPKEPVHMTDYGVDQPYGIFGIDTRPDPGVRLLGCVAYRLPDQRVVDYIGMFFVQRTAEAPGLIRDCVAYADPQAPPVPAFNIANMAGGGLTGVSSAESAFTGEVSPDADLRETPTGLVAETGCVLVNPEGATVSRRYVDGELTDQPLWPWPMDGRIEVLIGVNVTETVLRLGGGSAPGP